MRHIDLAGVEQQQCWYLAREHLVEIQKWGGINEWYSSFTVIPGILPIKENTLLQLSQTNVRSLNVTGCWVFYLQIDKFDTNWLLFALIIGNSRSGLRSCIFHVKYLSTPLVVFLTLIPIIIPPTFYKEEKCHTTGSGDKQDRVKWKLSGSHSINKDWTQSFCL